LTATGPGFRLRVLGQSALLSYKGTFTWLEPKVYFSMKFVTPLIEMAYFAFLGKFILGDEGMRYAALGNAVLHVAVNGVMGVTISVGSERWWGTMAALLVTPANRFFIFVGKAVMHILDGIISVIIALGYAAFLFGVDFSRTNWGALTVIVPLTAVCVIGYGLLMGSYSLITRNVGAVFNAAFFALMLISGANFPVSQLPSWIQPISYAIPLTYGIEAARQAVEGTSLTALAPLLALETLTGVALLALGYVLFAQFERAARKRGAVDIT